jgi:flagellin-like hook-associated protein FlgL
MDHLNTHLENSTLYNAHIRDTDIALESSNLIQQNVIRDAGLSILTQVNQLTVSARNLLLNR